MTTSTTNTTITTRTRADLPAGAARPQTTAALTRRGWLALLGAQGLVAGCGGGSGGSPPSAPAIQGLQADPPTVGVGERARLTATFSGGSGRIEPGIGAVTSGVPVDTPVLDGPRRYTLVVEAPGQPSARRELDLAVGYRDRYRPLPGAFAVQYHAAVTAADGSVVVIGGSRGDPTLSEAIDRFDPVTGRFTRIGSLRTGRAQHTATRLADGRILVVGGQLALSVGPIAELIDEATGAVTDAGLLVQPRTRHASVALADGRVLVVGGQARRTAELWDPATRTFRLLASRLQHVREYPSATLLADGRVLVFGGDHDPAVPHGAGELFDPVTEAFTPLAADQTDERRLMHQAFRMADGTVLVVGGEVTEHDFVRPLDSVLRFDPASGRLTRAGTLDRPRTLVRGLLLPGDELRLFGGQTAADGVARSASAWRAGGNPPARALADMPDGRAWHTVSRLGDGRVLILGGDRSDGWPVTTGWLYD